jgi:hypothetical protein
MVNRSRIIFLIFLFSAMLAVAGCATVPKGPSVLALPGQGKTFEEFQVDDAVCQQWAARQIGVSPQEAMDQSTAKGAVAGTIIGAGLGAAIGSVSGDVGSGAAIGAASGLLLGASSGASAGQMYGWEAQRRYDIAYTQCMYAKGNQIPGVVTRTRTIRRVPPPPPPGPGSAPPGYYPPYPATPPPVQ